MEATVTYQKITRGRARELRIMCSPSAFMDPRCKDFAPETEREVARVKKVWDTIPSGLSSYFTTLCDIEQGRMQG